MGVLIAGNARVAYDQGLDNNADRLLGLQSASGWAPELSTDIGAVIALAWGHELIEVSVGIDIFVDGESHGDNHLTSITAPFTKTMLGLQTLVSGYGKRTIEEIISASEIVFNGPPIPAATDLRFTRPLGWATFDDGVIEANELTSASEPFYEQLVGRNIVIHGLGKREIVAFTSPGQVTVDGVAMANARHSFSPCPRCACKATICSGPQAPWSSTLIAYPRPGNRRPSNGASATGSSAVDSARSSEARWGPR